MVFAYGAFTLSDWSFQGHSAILKESIIRSEPRCARTPVWALPISLAATLGIDCFFLFLRVLRCFSSPGSPHYAMYLRNDNTTLLVLSFLIRISTDQRSFATPRSFSQLVTSFFGAMYQGILLYALCSLFFFNISFTLRPIQSYSSL